MLKWMENDKGAEKPKHNWLAILQWWQQESIRSPQHPKVFAKSAEFYGKNLQPWSLHAYRDLQYPGEILRDF